MKTTILHAFADFASSTVRFHPVRRSCWARPSLLLIAAHFVSNGFVPAAIGEETSGDVVSVYSSVSPNWKRPANDDGSPKVLTYAFGEGGMQGDLRKDFSIDRMGFIDIARTIAPALSAQKFSPCDRKDPSKADLLIMVYWGATTGTDGTSSSAEYAVAQTMNPPPRATLGPPPTGDVSAAMVSDPSTSGRSQQQDAINAVKASDDSLQQQSLVLTTMANRQREKQDIQNATILGYLEELKRVNGYASTALSSRRKDVVGEVEESRYYVILMAYDFQEIHRNKKRKLLWETRYSIPEKRNDFSKQLAAMTHSASRFFGKDSQGLLRKPLPATNVELGELKTIGIEGEPDK